jgi:hypothetical protein
MSSRRTTVARRRSGGPPLGHDAGRTSDVITRRIAGDHATGGRARLTPRRLWTWLTTCAADDCSRHPTHLGWCEEHAPVSDRGPDEYWGDPDDDSS